MYMLCRMTLGINDRPSRTASMLGGIEQPPPPWLKPWLNICFYKTTCSIHDDKYLTVFCGSCMGTAFCKTCWESMSDKHKDHPIVRVCIASHRAAIRTERMRRFWDDISDIQPYKINRSYILHLKPNEGLPAKRKLDSPKCETCKRNIMDYKYRFCSISCKVESSKCYKQIEQSTETSEGSFRRKSRKGIPKRAPLK